MAKALIGGHANRALDFYNVSGKYFIIGGTENWGNSLPETDPPVPDTYDYRLVDIIGLKKVDMAYLIIPTDTNESSENVIVYRGQNWKKVVPPVSTHITTDISVGNTVFQVDSVHGLTAGSRIRVGNKEELYIKEINSHTITVSTPFQSSHSAGSSLLAGSIVERAYHVYLECSLEFDKFPVLEKDGTRVSYRQIGVVTGVPHDQDILLSARYSDTGVDEYTSTGTLEILDNRVKSTRDENQKEKLSLIIEF